MTIFPVVGFIYGSGILLTVPNVTRKAVRGMAGPSPDDIDYAMAAVVGIMAGLLWPVYWGLVYVGRGLGTITRKMVEK